MTWMYFCYYDEHVFISDILWDDSRAPSYTVNKCFIYAVTTWNFHIQFSVMLNISW